MVVHASEVGSGELQAIFQSLKREATEQASLFLVVCVDEVPDARDRSARLATIINEARWQAISEPSVPEQLCIADLRIDRERVEVTRGGRTIHLSPIEYRLLETLMLHHDRVLDVKFLMATIFRNEPTSAPCNILWVYMHRLREKLDRPPLEPLIHTIRSRGYMLRSPDVVGAIS